MKSKTEITVFPVIFVLFAFCTTTKPQYNDFITSDNKLIPNLFY